MSIGDSVSAAPHLYKLEAQSQEHPRAEEQEEVLLTLPSTAARLCQDMESVDKAVTRLTGGV